MVQFDILWDVSISLENIYLKKIILLFILQSQIIFGWVHAICSLINMIMFLFLFFLGLFDTHQVISIWKEFVGDFFFFDSHSIYVTQHTDWRGIKKKLALDHSFHKCETRGYLKNFLLFFFFWVSEPNRIIVFKVNWLKMHLIFLLLYLIVCLEEVCN